QMRRPRSPKEPVFGKRPRSREPAWLCAIRQVPCEDQRKRTVAPSARVGPGPQPPMKPRPGSQPTTKPRPPPTTRPKPTAWGMPRSLCEKLRPTATPLREVREIDAKKSSLNHGENCPEANATRLH